MSLTTRCPACATRFKLVADQLLVAQGWVRCGHCGDVFDASLQLAPGDGVGLSVLALAPVTMPAPGQAGTAQREPPSPLLPAVLDDPPEKAGAAWAGASFLPPEFLDAAADARAPQGDFSTGSADAEPAAQSAHPKAEEILIHVPPVDGLPGYAPPEPQSLQSPALTSNVNYFKLKNAGIVDFHALDTGVSRLPVQEAKAIPEVSFVREARRKEFWKTPRVRAVLGLMSLLLLAALALQWLVQKKDFLAAQEPRLAPLIQALCRPLGCEIQPLRRIESLVIDSSSFIKSGPDAYRLTFVLKNTGAAALEMPALDMTLTDSRDQALVRRVVLPAQFGATAVTLGAHSELAGAVNLKASLPVNGYRILAFYP